VRRAAIPSPTQTLIVIPSKGRADNQITLASLRAADVLDRTLICVTQDEAEEYRLRNRDVEIVAVPDDVVGIAAKRKWILLDLSKQRSARYVLMADDDLTFCRRVNVASAKLETIRDKASLRRLLQTLESWLVNDNFVHVGLSARYMNHAKRGPFAECASMAQFCAHDCVVLAELVAADKLELGRIPLMEDVDLTLQLLRLGHRNRVSHEFACGQPASHAPGGCSSYRTPDMQRQAAELLAQFHPGLVRVVTKRSAEHSPGWKGMKERRDVVIQWKKAAGLMSVRKV
jgi:hypothetical protein